MTHIKCSRQGQWGDHPMRQQEPDMTFGRVFWIAFVASAGCALLGYFLATI